MAERREPGLVPGNVPRSCHVRVADRPEGRRQDHLLPMTRNRISLSHVDLHYSASAFAHRSLKSWLTDRLRGRREVLVRDIHALKDITLEIRPGERVGLIGANGAGKSSLLKMIAGLYPPSGGRRNVIGVVRSILEIGLG